MAAWHNSVLLLSVWVADLDKVVLKTDGYSGSDMRNLIQEACQGPVRSAVASHGEAVASLCDADLRPVRTEACQLPQSRQTLSLCCKCSCVLATVNPADNVTCTSQATGTQTLGGLNQLCVDC